MLDSDSIFGSPSKKKIKTGDRFIPNREGIDLLAAYNLDNDQIHPNRAATDTKKQRTEEANRNFSLLLRSELFGDSVPSNLLENPNKDYNYTTECKTPPRTTTPTGNKGGAPVTPKTQSRNIFTYRSPSSRTGNTPIGTPTKVLGRPNPNDEIYSLSPVRFDSQRLLTSPQKKPRPIGKVPYKVLDAPELQDDFYLNLVDWGAGNKLAVGLNTCVYLWSAITGNVVKLCDMAPDQITSVSWIQRGSHLAVGTTKAWYISGMRSTTNTQGR